MPNPYVRMVLAVFAGPVLFGLALVAATLVVATTGNRSLAAVVVATIVLPASWLLARRRPGGPATALALRRTGSVGAGILVVGVPAAVVLGGDALAGGVRVVAVDPALLVAFLAATTVFALLQEALPEELAFRGLAFGALEGASRRLAATVSTALFVLVPAAASGAGTALAAAVVPGAGPVRFAPEGQHPVDYLVLLALFGTVLVLLRLLTGSVWACVGAHLTFLAVNRVLLGRAGDGAVVDLPPDGELLVPTYLLLAIAGLAAALALRNRRARRRQQVAAVG